MYSRIFERACPLTSTTNSRVKEGQLKTPYARAMFELGAATGAGAGPYVAAWAYKKFGDAVAVPLTCAASGVGALAVLGVACAADARRRQREITKRVASSSEEEATMEAGAGARRNPLDEESYGGDVSLRQPLLRRGDR